MERFNYSNLKTLWYMACKQRQIDQMQYESID